MSVEIYPTELGFRRPFQEEVSQTLRITNPNHTPVAFKVKTTAPKQYCVRPNSGRIESGKHVEVSVLLQPMKQEPPLDAKCRDKFLVQSVAVTADKEFSNIGAIWQHVDNAEKSLVQEKKIRVAFLPAEGGVSTPKRGNEQLSSNGDAYGSAPPSYNSPSPEPAFTPQQHTSGPVSTFDEKPAGSNSLGDAKASSTNPATQSTLSSAATAVSNAVPTSVEELKSQLAQAQATIASYGQEGGLRLRKAVGAAGDDSTTGTTDISVRQQSSEGVPVQIVAALCLLSFLLAYLFF